MSRKADRLSFGMCGETCPALDNKVYEAYQDICEALKLDCDNKRIVFEILIEIYLDKFKDVGTHLLRNSLTEACETIIELESKVDELECEIKNS